MYLENPIRWTRTWHTAVDYPGLGVLRVYRSDTAVKSYLEGQNSDKYSISNIKKGSFIK